MTTKKLSNLFYFIFIIIFAPTVITALVNMNTNKFYYISLVAGIALLFFAGFIFKKMQENSSNISVKKIDIAFYLILIFMLVMQLFIGYKLMYIPKTDLGSIMGMARGFAQSGDFTQIYKYSDVVKEGYIARYTNNNMIFVLMSFYYRALYLIFGYIPIYASILINVIALNSSVLFIYFTAKRIFNPVKALAVGILCLFFLPFYLFTPYFYTDSLSAPFAVIPIYFIIKGLQSDKNILL